MVSFPQVIFILICTPAVAFLPTPNRSCKTNGLSLFNPNLNVPLQAEELIERAPLSSLSTSDFQLSTGGNHLLEGIGNWLVQPANAADGKVKPPTNDEIKLLRDALGAIYGERNPEKAEGLLNEAIDAWQRQPPDEKAALYRVRGDCYMVRTSKEFSGTFRKMN